MKLLLAVLLPELLLMLASLCLPDLQAKLHAAALGGSRYDC